MANNEIYETVETTSTRNALDHLIMNLEEPIILIGGWAVYLLVDERYQKEHQTHYLGSRDVDIGFHIDPGKNTDELLKSNFARSIRIIKDLGYFESGTSRYLRIIHRATGKVLTERDAASIPQYDLFYMYVDPIVDNATEHIKSIFKLSPIDEPLLGKALMENRMRKLKYLGRDVLVPEVDMMVRMKLSSFPKRTKDDKKIKDACDLYALIWHSSWKFKDLIDVVRKEEELIKNCRPHFSEEIMKKAGFHLGIEPETYVGVMEKLWI